MYARKKQEGEGEDAMSETLYDMTRSMKNSMRSNTNAAWIQTGMLADQIRYQKKQVELSELASQMQSKSLSLQKKGIEQSRQQTKELGKIGINTKMIAADTREMVEQSRQQNENLKALVYFSAQANLLKKGEINAINELTAHVDQRSLESQLWQRRQWIDGTKPGLYYRAWEQVAQDTIERSCQYTKRMAKAREKDLQDRYIKHLIELGLVEPAPVGKESYPVKPKMEPLEEVPNIPSMTDPFGEFGEEEEETINSYPWDKRDEMIAHCLSGIIYIIACGVAYKFIGAGALLPLILLAIFFPLVDDVLNDALSNISVKLHSKTVAEIARHNDEIRKEQDKKWNKKISQIKEIRARADAINEENTAKQDRYLIAMGTWKTECARIDDAYDYKLNLAEKSAENHNTASKQQSRKMALKEVRSSTCWASHDPIPIVQNNSEYIKKSYLAGGIKVEELPDPRIPTFANPDSIPETAPHMKAELCQIIAEYAEEQMENAEESDHLNLPSVSRPPIPEKPALVSQPINQTQEIKPAEQVQPAEPIKSKSSSSSEIPDGTYMLTRQIQREGNRQIQCTALVKNGCFYLQKGSTIAKTEAQSANSGCSDDVLRLRHDSNIVDDGILLKEVEFPSPTSAGSFVIGGYCKGWNVWKTPEGTPLSKLRN